MKQARSVKRERGVVLVTFAVSIVTLLLFFGLTVDVGFWYMSRAALSKGTDAAALMGVRSLSDGEDVARDIAENTFAMNYAASNLPARQAEPPQVNVSFVRDANNNLRVAVRSSVRINTFFIRLIPGWDTVSVSANAQAARAKLIMSLVLDRSGSMNSNGGAAALPGAVETFINFFDDANDQVALSTYASHATLNVNIGHNFKSDIRSAVRSMRFSGWTYAHGGIDIGRAQINSVTVNPNENIIKALVFFTDGYANSFLANTNCRRRLTLDLILVPGSGERDFVDPSDGSSVECDDTRTRYFFSNKYQQLRRRNSSNVSEEGVFMAEYSAGLARSDKSLVFAIGLGNNINKNSLRIMANDPSSPSYNPAEPEGVAAFAPNAADLDDVFRQIAAKILLRLTQ